jgi:arylformamidase
LIKGRIVDLSHKLIPGKEEYGLELTTHFTDEVLPEYKRDSDVWYILQDIKMSSHCGTHIEFPYHHNKNGMDAGNFPLERLIGDALLLDFTHKKPGDPVTLEELKKYDEKIRENDILLFNFNCSRFYYTENAHERPYITTEAIKWLAIEKKIGMIGSDASGIEVKGIPNQPNHQFLMDHGIPIIEFAANLDQLEKERFTLFVLAICIEGLNSCPVRLVAIEAEDDQG